MDLHFDTLSDLLVFLGFELTMYRDNIADVRVQIIYHSGTVLTIESGCCVAKEA